MINRYIRMEHNSPEQMQNGRRYQKLSDNDFTRVTEFNRRHRVNTGQAAMLEQAKMVSSFEQRRGFSYDYKSN